MYTAVILKYNDECLLCKRSPNFSHPNMWFVPAGKIEFGETPRESAVRELEEETNIVVSESDLQFIGTIPALDENGKKQGSFIYVFICEIDGKITPDLHNAINGYEHTECDYFNYNEIDRLKMDPSISELIKKNF
jgi:8-oxo-dGTP pyrophosphatase MutT (NUDIX family)